MKLIGIYKITSPSGKVYIGQSWDIQMRWRGYSHPSQARGQRHLYASFQKYGVALHLFAIAVQCGDTVSQDELDRLEQREMDACRAAGMVLMNCKEAGSRGKHSDESKAAMSKARRGKPRGPMSTEQKTKISLTLTGRPSHSWSDESKHKLSTAKSGIPMREETKAKLSTYWTGRNVGLRHRPASIIKMREAKARNAHVYIGNTWGRANKGRVGGKRNAITKRKMSVARFIGKWIIHSLAGERLGVFESSIDAGAKLGLPPSTLRWIRNEKNGIGSGLRITVQACA